ncbi:MAG: helix-turn-helix domain-containing protein [Clostridia bacterium]|nr:helix-turn-helix domain-containing protein [Clostridia bacterium]
MNSIITKLSNFQKFNNFPFHIDVISPTKTIDLHYHDCVEMIFVKNGYAINHLDSYPFHHSPGHVFLISGQVAHTMFDFKDFTAYRVLFDMSIFDEFDETLKNSPAFHSLFLMSNIPALNAHYHSIMSLQEKYTNRLIPVFDELLYAYEEGGIFAESYIKSLFYAAVSLIMKRYHEKIKAKNYYNLQLFHALTKNINENINISKFAYESNISSTYLYKIFKKYFDKSPKQIIKDIRIRNAKTLLALTDKPITEIAASCGYENPVYFTEVFKSTEGVSPSQFRKNTKKGDV